jgi:hypothetical protein
MVHVRLARSRTSGVGIDHVYAGLLRVLCSPYIRHVAQVAGGVAAHIGSVGTMVSMQAWYQSLIWEAGSQPSVCS